MIAFLRELVRHKMGLKPNPVQASSILVIRNDHIGDLILALPVLHAIRRAWPHATISLLVSSYAADIVRNSTDVDSLILQRKDEPQTETLGKIASARPDLVINFNATRRNAALVRRIPAKTKIGYAYKPYNMLSYNRFVFVHRSHPPIHETVFMLEFLKAAGIEIRLHRNLPPLMFLIRNEDNRLSAVLAMGLLAVDQKAKAFVEGYLRSKGVGRRKIVAFHAGDNGSAENWSFGKYLRFASTLAVRLRKKAAVFLILGPAEKDFIPQTCAISQKTGLKVIEADLSLSQLVAFLARVEILVAGSTGPLHIAGALNRKVIGLFPARREQGKEKWMPLGSRTLILEPAPGQMMEEGINGKIVMKTIQNLLD
jgi:ADP-heptose:LPS heptosyltransferase